MNFIADDFTEGVEAVGLDNANDVVGSSDAVDLHRLFERFQVLEYVVACASLCFDQQVCPDMSGHVLCTPGRMFQVWLARFGVPVDARIVRVGSLRILERGERDYSVCWRCLAIFLMPAHDFRIDTAGFDQLGCRLLCEGEFYE